MHFGSFRMKSVEIGKDRKFKKVSEAFRKTHVHPVSGRHDR